MAKKILIIEDDPDIQEILKYNLERAKYQVKCVTDGEKGLAVVPNLEPNLVILDLMLPGMDGLTICTQMRRDPQTAAVPILILTAKSQETDIVVGLELGADDYMTKPFSPHELLARVKALLRRSAPEKEKDILQSLISGPVQLDLERHEVYRRGEQVKLTLTEFNLLAILLNKPGKVFSRDQLLEKITGNETYLIDRNVDVHIRAIRKKLGDDAEFIVTVRGVGYKWKEASSEVVTFSESE